MGTDGGKFDVSDRITADRLNRKTVLVDTGVNIGALAPTPGQLAFCTFTGSGFTAGVLYERNVANSAWVPISVDGTGGMQGDSVKHNGTNFVRFAKGTAYQIPRVNSGATDLEYSALEVESVAADFLPHLLRKGNFQIGIIPAAVPSLWTSTTTGTGSVTYTYTTNGNNIILDTGSTNGSTVGVIIPNGAGLSSSVVFFACSVSPSSVTTNQRIAFGSYNFAPSADNVAGFGFRVVDAGNFFAVNGNGISPTITDTGVAPGAKHLVAIQTQSNIKFYIDGVLKASHTTNMPVLSGRHFYVYVTNTAGLSRTAQIYPPVVFSA